MRAVREEKTTGQQRTGVLSLQQSREVCQEEGVVNRFKWQRRMRCPFSLDLALKRPLVISEKAGSVFEK